VVLIVEDDTRFASILLSLVRESGFKGVVTGEGGAVPSLARRFAPDAIMLDIGLPDMDGLALLDLLKRTPETRHIPVQVISADDQAGWACRWAPSASPASRWSARWWPRPWRR
jgi:DNA-binding response OmpR family regulator